MSNKPYLMPLGPKPDVIMTSGQGSYLTDESGVRYLDFVQGWAVNTLGHAPAELQRALREQSARLLTASPAYYNAPQLELAARLCQRSGLDLAFLCSTGAEAIEAAIKLARKWGQKQRNGAFKVISAQNGFHGRTLAAMAASGKPGFEKMFNPLPEGFAKVPYGDVHALSAAVDAQTAAVLLEPIQGEAGVIVPPPGYLRAVRALCDEAGLLLMLDEIQTGIGRTGSLFRFQEEEILPDVLTLGKQLGGGVPLAAVLTRDHAFYLEPGEHGGTFAGNPLMAACGLAVLDAVDDALLTDVRRSGQLLESGLRELMAKHAAREVRGAGLLWALELSEPIAADIAARCMERQLLVNAARPTTLRFMPQLRVTGAEIGEMLTILGAALSR